jgi:hypothetical protein
MKAMAANTTTVPARVAAPCDVDEADGADFVVRTTHRVDAVDDERSRITYRMEITGPAAETVGPAIGPEISSDFPQVLAALATRAEGGA